MIEVIEPGTVVATTVALFGMDREETGVLAPSYLAAVLRRLAGFLCPCSPRTLVRTMIDSHRGLVADEDSFEALVERSIEALVAIGDLLELSDVALVGEQVRSTWLVAAPPAFVARPSGSAFILGLSADEQTPLPTEMRTRVVNRFGVRYIEPLPGEDLATALRELGLRELSNAAWMKCPKTLPATDLLASYNAKLSACLPSGGIPDLLVLDGSRETRSYRRRWGLPGLLTGNFVVRRPQTFGSDLWGYAQLRDGIPLTLLDLPLHGDRFRGCDAAWRLQMAIDAVALRSQGYRLRSDEHGATIDLFSPIPKWARRRLAVVGSEVDPDGCLMSFRVAAGELATEEKFLKEMLYLDRSANEEGH
ncbi:hypothetical protein U1872_21070 [Sphingomonas sp. RB3P16]|uniref:hypothetical protein n=1 Tax=Parasphingomonas frigoris TaxID=3096163 RepID=UPI002FC903A2